ncbi:hypothetical protein GCM10023334_041810 [Nonomuraea thailandensis]
MTEEQMTAWARALRDEQAAEASRLWERPASGQPSAWLAESEVEALVRIVLALTVYAPQIEPDEPIALLTQRVEAQLAERVAQARGRAERARSAPRARGLRR